MTTPAHPLIVPTALSLAEGNVRRFILFRVFFNARFYYPVFGVLFLDYGLTIGQISMLNFVWAVAIVGLEVPSGAIADQFGRRPLLIAASAFMVMEMLLLAFVPLGNPTVLFTAFLLNRVLSGAAEAAASGADEALAYDSLALERRTSEWPRVLEKLGRWSSIAFLFATLVGALVYDAALLQRVAAAIGLDLTLDAKTTMRFPVYLTLGLAVCALITTLRMKEPSRGKHDNDAIASSVVTSIANPVTTPVAPLAAASFGIIRAGFAWLLKSPLALFLIAAGLLHDSIIRLIMTLSSNYFRLIHIPIAWFGIIGASLGLLGFVVPTLGRRLVERRSIAFNFTLLAMLTFAGLAGLALNIPWYSMVFVALLSTVMGLLTFFVSSYLNAMIDSSERATILSFRGLAFNMGYGLVSVLFAGLMRHLTSTAAPGTSQEMVFAASLSWLPWYFLVSLLPLATFARSSGCLRAVPTEKAPAAR